MKLLHTSDWHLGRALYGRRRYDEFSAFLDWLGDTIETEKIEVLLVAGDIFDNSTPGNQAQELYYRFLCRMVNSGCRHIVIIAGNHDSPSFLDAPKKLLHTLNVNVIGAKTESIADEVIILEDKNGMPAAIICAVPYLRDKDLRTVEPGETVADKNSKLIAGLHRHYAEVCAAAEQQRRQLNTGKPGFDIPIIAMGHLFTSGGRTSDDDGVRELYVGSLAHVGKDLFPEVIDYLALGHLHIPQCVAETEYFRYSGSPIPMGFGEARQQKEVVIIEFNNGIRIIRKLPVPGFQRLAKISGSLDEIRLQIEELKCKSSSTWLEIDYTDSQPVGNLKTRLDEFIEDSSLEILRVNNHRIIDKILHPVHEHETLDDLDLNEVFSRCLDNFKIPAEERSEITRSYNEIINALHEDDVNAQ